MSIENNINTIRNEIPQEVKLLAVSKTKSIEEMEEAYRSGLRDFGENKVQELISKYEAFHDDVKWHQIGVLQTNKIKYLVGKVHLIHSVSSIKLINQIEKEFSKHKVEANILLQINVAKEETKSGFYVEEIFEAVEEVEKCNYVKVKGIMAVIPKGDDESNRKNFKETKKIFDKLSEKSYKNICMEVLSMGMTHDYKIAIEEGSNLIRIGEGIFGKRNYITGGVKDE